MYFSNKKSDVIEQYSLKMRDGNVIPYVIECAHLGTRISTDLYNINQNVSIADLNSKTNYLLSEFSFTESISLSKLFDSYCMSVYGSQLWQYNKCNIIEPFYTAWRKCIKRIWNISPRTHNNLLCHINNCLPIEVQLDKRCIKYIWNLINSEYDMHKRMVKYSLNNSDTKIGENVRHFMYKYKLSYKDWYSPLHIIYRQIDIYVTKQYITDVFHTGHAIREL